MCQEGDKLDATTGDILVVDDELTNRVLLRDLLRRQGHRVTEAVDGEDALASVEDSPPDVILLDVMMPGIDGLEVCRRLTQDERTASIPILLVTALHDRNSRIAGIEAGARDFITKPVDVRDVLLRVRNALQSKKLLDKEVEHARKLLELEQMKDSLIHMLVHDLRTPLTSLNANLQLLEADEFGSRGELAPMPLVAAGDICGRLGEMVEAILDVHRFEAGSLVLDVDTVSAAAIIDSALRLVGAEGNRVRVDIPAESVHLDCDPRLVRRIVLNLVDNATKFAPVDSQVVIRLSKSDGRVRVGVVDQGPGIPEEEHERIFEKFGHCERRGRSTGLGLTFCKLAVESHGGTIGVDSAPGRGSTFWFELPQVAVSV